jgi:ABC-type lipoprotein release transport system permease subunit
MSLMIGLGALMEGLLRQMETYATDLSLGQVQLHRQEFIDDRELYAQLPADLLQALEADTPYRYAPRLYASALASAGDLSEGVLLKGVDVVREGQVTRLPGHLRRGSFALGEPVRRASAEHPAIHPVVLGYRLAERLKVDVGGEIVLITQAADGSIGNGLFQVVGVLSPVELGFDRSGMLLSIQAFNTLMVMHGGYHEIAVRLPPDAPVEAAQQRIQDLAAAWTVNHELPATGGAVVVRRWQQINPTVADMLSFSDIYTTVISVIIFSIAALGMLNTMLMAVFERSREFGILMAMGVGRFSLTLMVLLESFFLSLVGGLVGGIAGALLGWWLEVDGIDFSSYMPDGIDWAGVILEPVYRGHLLWKHVWTAEIIMIAIIMAASLIPTWRTVRLKPAQVLHG